MNDDSKWGGGGVKRDRNSDEKSVLNRRNMLPQNGQVDGTQMFPDDTARRMIGGAGVVLVATGCVVSNVRASGWDVTSRPRLQVEQRPV